MESYPYTTEGIPEEDQKLLKKYQPRYPEGFMQVGPNRYCFPVELKHTLPIWYNLKVRPDQTFVLGIPRSGTTWTQLIVWLIKNNLDYENCDKERLEHTFFFLESNQVFDQKSLDTVKSSNMIRDIPALSSFTEQRYVKSHVPMSLLPPPLLDTAKVVYIVRDPRDVIVSWSMTFSTRTFGYEADLKILWNMFVKDQLIYCPFFQHVKEAWDQRNHPNMMFIYYEDLINDRFGTLRKISTFFGKHYTDEQLTGLCQYLDIGNLKDKQTYNHEVFEKLGILKEGARFVRQGKSGGWRQHFDAEMTAQAEHWIAQNLKDTDLTFPWTKM